MRILSRAVFREVAASSLVGILLFTFVFFLQRLGNGKMFELLLRSTATPETVGRLLALAIPPTLPFTVPVGVLVGVLIALSRMSSDNEVVAMRAAGVAGRKLVGPVLAFGFLGMLAAGAASLWLTPWSIRETIRISNELIATQLTAEIQPRVFEESFPNSVLYVGDVVAGPVVRWRRVFMADLRPAEQRKSGAVELGDAPPITIAEDAIAAPDAVNNRIQISMRNGSTHEVGKNPAEDYSTSFPRGEQTLEAQKRTEARAKSYSEIDTVPLYRMLAGLNHQSRIDARIELEQRLALPWGCLLLALAAIPLGLSTRKSGKSTAFVITVILAFLYYMGMITLIGLAREGAIPVSLAVWTPDAVFLIAGLFFLSRLERPGDFDPIGAIRTFFKRSVQSLRKRRDTGNGVSSQRGLAHGGGRRLWLGPQIVDTYILNTFLFYFLLLLTSFVLMAEVFTFFELLSDIVKNRIPMWRVATYLFFLAPKLIYDSTPLSVLVAVLVTFGILSKNNEVTAFKACGVSLYRLAIPVLLASGVLSAGLFAFDHYYVPEANRKQDAIRAEIKDRPAQTYLRPDRKWIFGKGSRIYYYKFFEPENSVMVGVSVYELNPATFRLTRLITAERARWEPSLKTWVLQNGWMRRMDGIKVTAFESFDGRTATFPELDEPPSYFLKEVKQSQQMNFIELENYIAELRQSGLDTVKLQVQLQGKFSTPIFAFIMALLSVPFAFRTGSRGAMAGVGVSLGIAIAYWSLTKLFEQIGYLNQLPPNIAAWAPDAIFAVAGLWLLARLRT